MRFVLRYDRDQDNLHPVYLDVLYSPKAIWFRKHQVEKIYLLPKPMCGKHDHVTEHAVRSYFYANQLDVDWLDDRLSEIRTQHQYTLDGRTKFYKMFNEDGSKLCKVEC